MSPSTVSRVLNGTQRVDAKRAERVLAVVEELGYLPNSMKRHERTIALVVPMGFTARANWSASTLDGVIDGSGPYHVSILRTDRLPEMRPGQAKAYWRQFVMHMGVRGVIVVHGTHSPRICTDLRAAEVPYLVFGRGAPTDDWVWCDNAEVIKEALTHAFNLGHRRIGFLRRDSNEPDHVDRVEAYRAFIEEHGLVRDEMVFGDESGLQLEHVVDRMLARQDRPTALFVADAEGGVRVLNRMRDLGLSVPDDLSIISMGHSPILQAWRPRLTLVVRRLHDGARMAVETLLSITQEPRETPTQLIVPSDLIPGESVAPVR